MSKNLVLAVVLMALIFVSCGQSEKEAARIEAARQDSIAKVEAELQKIREDSIRQAEERRNRVTPDLAFFELKGPVKSVSSNYNMSEAGFKKSISFTEDGTAVAPKGVKFKRSNGKITSVSYYESYMSDWLGDSYSINAEGKIISSVYSGIDGGGRSKYSYDDQGLLIKESSSGACEGEPYYENVTYNYQSFDDYGNWTKRVAKSSYGTTTQIRNITYYE